MERGTIVIIHNHENNKISVKIELVNGNVWLTKHEIADFFKVYTQAVASNLKILFADNDLFAHEVTKYVNGVMLYNLDVIIALSFKMKGGYCRLFREWIRERIKAPIIESPKVPVYIQLSKNTILN